LKRIYFKEKKKQIDFYYLNACPHEEQNLATASVRIAPHCVQAGFAAT